MATTTPNYGWAVPTSTDLVKDGATAIETLGDAIDASMNTALGTKKAGMVLLNTTSFSAVASTSATANTFTSTYDAYKILINITANTADGDIFYKNRLSGTDASTDYYNMRVLADSSGGGVLSYSNTNNVSYLTIGRTNTASAQGGIDLTVYRPKIADRTHITCITEFSLAASVVAMYIGGSHNTATAYDAFTIGCSSGTISGNYSVFGVNK